MTRSLLSFFLCHSLKESFFWAHQHTRFAFDYLEVLDDVALDADVGARGDRVAAPGAVPLAQQLLEDGQDGQVVGQVGRRHVVVDVVLFVLGGHAAQRRGAVHADVGRALHQTVGGRLASARRHRRRRTARAAGVGAAVAQRRRRSSRALRHRPLHWRRALRTLRLIWKARRQIRK